MSISVDLQRGDLVVAQAKMTTISDSRLLPETELADIMASLPKGLVAYLRQPYVSKKSLRPFGRIRKAIRDHLDDAGLLSVLGWIINPNDAHAVNALFKKAQTEWKQEVEKFVRGYEENCDKMMTQLREKLAAYPQFAETIVRVVEKHRPSTDSLEQRFRFAPYIYPLRTDGEWDESHEKDLASGLISLRQGLFGELVAAVALSASTLLARCQERFKRVPVAGRVVKSQTRRAAERPIEKLYRLSFLDSRTVPLAKIVEQAMTSLPGGSLHGQPVDDFLAVLTAMGDQHHLLACLEQGLPLLSIKSAQPDLLSQAAGVPAVEAVPPEETTVPVPMTGNHENVPKPAYGSFAF